jgi:pimeloyl-ACP methyl ester carboxylesterase
MFTASFLPDGNAAQNELFNEIQRTSATPETAFKFLKSIGSVDVRDIARSVNVPTLVMHRKGDLAIPVRFGQELAAQMPNARLELLEGSNHWMAAEKPEDISDITALINDFISVQQ